jgi:hypothetical protein
LPDAVAPFAGRRCAGGRRGPVLYRGAAIKAVDFDGWEIASLRAGIAAITLILLSGEARRGWGARTLLVGAAYAIACIMFVLATRLTTSANAIFIQSASPLFVFGRSVVPGPKGGPSRSAKMPRQT